MPRVLCLFLLLFPLCLPAEPLRIGTLEDPMLAEVGNRLLREAYRRAGVEVVFVPLPLRRAPVMLRSGQLDGDFLRTPAFFDANPDLLRVEPALHQLAYWVHRRPPCGRQPQPADFSGLRVAYLRGAVAVESQLQTAQLEAVSSPGDALLRLEQGRSEATVLAFTPAMLSAAQRAFPDLCHDRLPLLSLDFFHALAPQHAALRPRLSAAVRSMQQDGFSARTLAEGEQALLHQWQVAPRR